MGDVTTLLERAGNGERDALDQLFDLLYPELRRIAHARLAPHERQGELGTTALVNECYMKFVRAGRLAATNRAHFFGYCAATMRSIIVDTVRAAQAERRGGDVQIVALDTAIGDGAAAPETGASDADRLLDLDRALRELAGVEPRLVRVVEMRYFAEMGDDDIAEALGVTARTVRRDWQKARLLLALALEG